MPLKLNQRPEGRVTEYHAPFKAEGTDIRNSFGVIVGGGIDEVHAYQFAAAPDMLAALKLAEGRLALLLRIFPDEHDECDHPVATTGVHNSVLAAIAKAEGTVEAAPKALPLIVSGYIITHPHDPYEGNAEIHINEFEGDVTPWQAQIYVEGSLVESDYFQTEAEALRWAAREMTLIVCVAKAEGREG